MGNAKRLCQVLLTHKGRAAIAGAAAASVFAWNLQEAQEKYQQPQTEGVVIRHGEGEPALQLGAVAAMLLVMGDRDRGSHTQTDTRTERFHHRARAEMTQAVDQDQGHIGPENDTFAQADPALQQPPLRLPRQRRPDEGQKLP